MAQFRNSFEGGSNGVGLTTGNTGGASGDAFTAVENALAFTDSDAAHGDLSIRAPLSESNSAQARWGVGSVREVAVRLYVKQPSAATNDTGIIRVTHVGDTTALNAYLNGANALRISAKGNTNVWTSGTSFPVGVWVRIEVYLVQGTTSSSGSVRVAYYLGDSLIPEADSGTIEGLNYGGADGEFINVRLGKLSLPTGGGWLYDDFAVNTAADATGFIGPYDEDSVAIDVVSAPYYVVDARASTGSEPPTYTVARISGVTLTYSEPEDGLFYFTQDEAASAVYRITATVGGATSTEDVTIPVGVSVPDVIIRTPLMPTGATPGDTWG